MTGPYEPGEFARLRGQRPGHTGDATPDCLDDDTLAALAEGSLKGTRHAAALSHLATCGNCRRAVASVARAVANPELAAEIRAVESGSVSRIRRFTPVALGVSAAAAVILLLVIPGLKTPPSSHRAPPITAAPAPQAVAPVGRVAQTSDLRWTAVEGADRYRVTLFDSDGAVRFEAEVTETNALLPSTVVLVAGRTYAWRVEARLGFDRWASSDLIEFAIAEPPQQ